MPPNDEDQSLDGIVDVVDFVFEDAECGLQVLAIDDPVDNSQDDAFVEVEHIGE